MTIYVFRRLAAMLPLLIATAIASDEQAPRQDRSWIFLPDNREQRAELRPDAPVPCLPGPHLLIDDALIASSSNINRVVHSPQRDPNIPNPIVTGSEDRAFQPYFSVSRSPETGRFRMWYGASREDLDDNHSHLAYLESDDGVHWDRPARILEDPGVIDFGAEVIDRGPDYQDPSQRYVYSYYHGGLRLAVSPDGLNFRPLVDRAVLEHNHDINSILWDPLRRQYVAIVSTRVEHPRFKGIRRTTMQSTSTDLLNWKKPWYVLRADDRYDEGDTQFYALQGFLTRGPLTIGMVKILRDDLQAEDTAEGSYGLGWTCLAWSRDGKTWVRDREMFFGPNPDPEAWDHSHAWIDEQLIFGDEVYLYYGGYKQGHKANRFTERQIGLVKMPLDRYVARSPSAGETGALTTVPLRINKQVRRLLVNAEGAPGGVRVQIESPDTGQPLAGFDWESCVIEQRDQHHWNIRWGTEEETVKKLARLEGENICLSFELTNAELFAFNFVEDEVATAAANHQESNSPANE